MVETDNVVKLHEQVMDLEAQLDKIHVRMFGCMYDTYIMCLWTIYFTEGVVDVLGLLGRV